MAYKRKYSSNSSLSSVIHINTEAKLNSTLAQSVSILPAIKDDLSTLNITHIANVTQVSHLVEENEALKLRVSVLEGKN